MNTEPLPVDEPGPGLAAIAAVAATATSASTTAMPKNVRRKTISSP